MQEDKNYFSATLVTLALLLGLLLAISAMTSCGGDKPKPNPPPNANCDMRPMTSGLCGSDSDDNIWRALNNPVGVPKDRSMFKDEYSVTTPGGMRIRSVVPIPAEYVALAERGVQKTIDKYKGIFPDWPSYVSLSDVDALVITGNCVGYENPTIIGAPLMCFEGNWTAGTVIGISENTAVKKMYLVIPHQDFALVDRPQEVPNRVHVESDWKYADLWEAAFANEMEHMVECAPPNSGAIQPSSGLTYCKRFQIVDDVHPHEVP